MCILTHVSADWSMVKRSRSPKSRTYFLAISLEGIYIQKSKWCLVAANLRVHHTARRRWFIIAPNDLDLKKRENKKIYPGVPKTKTNTTVRQEAET